MKKIYLILILLFAFSCKTANNNFYESNQYNVTIYRFLYKANYGIPLNEKSFWYYGINESEFIVQNYKGLDEIQFLNFLNKLKKSSPENPLTNPFEYHYAFVFTNKDTIYSNLELSKWKLKTKGNVFYYSSPDENSTVDDISFFDFFSNNPIFSELKYVKYPIKKN